MYLYMMNEMFFFSFLIHYINSICPSKSIRNQKQKWELPIKKKKKIFGGLSFSGNANCVSLLIYKRGLLARDDT